MTDFSMIDMIVEIFDDVDFKFAVHNLEKVSM